MESLKYVRPLSNNPSYLQEITNYYLRLAFELADQKKFNKAEELLLQAAQFSEHRYSVERVVAKMAEKGKKIKSTKLTDLSKKAGFINRWWIAGPFPNEKNTGARTKYFPEEKNYEELDSLDLSYYLTVLKDLEKNTKKIEDVYNKLKNDRDNNEKCWPSNSCDLTETSEILFNLKMSGQDPKSRLLQDGKIYLESKSLNEDDEDYYVYVTFNHDFEANLDQARNVGFKMDSGLLKAAVRVIRSD